MCKHPSGGDNAFSFGRQSIPVAPVKVLTGVNTISRDFTQTPANQIVAKNKVLTLFGRGSKGLHGRNKFDFYKRNTRNAVKHGDYQVFYFYAEAKSILTGQRL